MRHNLRLVKNMGAPDLNKMKEETLEEIPPTFLNLSDEASEFLGKCDQKELMAFYRLLNELDASSRAKFCGVLIQKESTETYYVSLRISAKNHSEKKDLLNQIFDMSPEYIVPCV